VPGHESFLTVFSAIVTGWSFSAHWHLDVSQFWSLSLDLGR